MPHEDNRAYRQSYVERLSSPDDLNQLMTVVNAKDWIALLAIGLLLALGMIWSIFGSIPATVAGRGLLLLHLEGPNSSLVSISYFPVKDGRKIQPGMVAQVTPDTVERSRFGGIVARVVSVSPPPVTRESATSMTGNADLIQGLMSPAAWVVVTLQLQNDPSAPSGYRWSSAPGPGLKMSPGIATTAHVTIERRAPISYVFPSLRDAIGFY